MPEKDPADVLNQNKCLEYLAALRHAKWFQVKTICTMDHFKVAGVPDHDDESNGVGNMAQTDLGLRLTPKYSRLASVTLFCNVCVCVCGIYRLVPMVFSPV